MCPLKKLKFIIKLRNRYKYLVYTVIALFKEKILKNMSMIFAQYITIKNTKV